MSKPQHADDSPVFVLEREQLQHLPLPQFQDMKKEKVEEEKF